MHVHAIHFERNEQVFVGGVRVNAELGEIAEETFAGVARAVREGGLCGLQEGLEVGSLKFGHGKFPA